MTPTETETLRQALTVTLEHALRSSSYLDDITAGQQYALFRLLRSL